MATFILALLEILGDIKYFLVVLVVVIFMFGKSMLLHHSGRRNENCISPLCFLSFSGDMFHLAVSTKDNGAFCERDDLEGPTLDFCNGQLTKSYLRVYVSCRAQVLCISSFPTNPISQSFISQSILLGDFELNDLQVSHHISTRSH